MEASLHLDILSQFSNIQVNPQTKVFEVLKYLLMMADSSSLTQSAHVTLLFQLYKLPDSLVQHNSQSWPKETWKQHTKAAIISHHEATVRQTASRKNKRRKTPPCSTWVLTTQYVSTVWPHVKMLAGDYLCFAELAHDRALDSQCHLCHILSHHSAPAENLEHVLTTCIANANTRTGLGSQLSSQQTSLQPHSEHPDAIYPGLLFLEPTF